MKKIILFMLAFITVVTAASCQYESQAIVIAQGDWDSNRFYNEVVKFILEEGYDKEVEVTQVGTETMKLGLIDGSIDLNLETWSANMPSYEQDIKDGYYEELGVNFDDNYQGLYIPTYIQEEYPGLVSIKDLVDYKHLFPDPDNSSWNVETDKAVVYGGPSSWGASNFFKNKFENSTDYKELVDNFEFRFIENTATLNTTIVSAFENNEPWVGYYWEPTDIMGQYDMTLLTDDLEFNSETGTGNMPTTDVTIVATAGFKDEHEDAANFLSKMKTSAAVVNSVLAYMTENELDTYEAAMWWLEQNVDVWGTWVTEDAKDLIETALKDL